MKSQANQAARRIARTAIQLIVGLGVVGITQLLGAHVPREWLPEFTTVVVLIVSAAQNYLEANHLLPIILPNSHPPAAPVSPAVESTGRPS